VPLLTGPSQHARQPESDTPRPHPRLASRVRGGTGCTVGPGHSPRLVPVKRAQTKGRRVELAFVDYIRRTRAQVISIRPDPIRDLRLTGEDGRHVKLRIQRWTARGSSDQRSLYVTIKTDNRTPPGFFIDEDDTALGSDDALFMLIAWLTRKAS
jgi:hypothetical protein